MIHTICFSDAWLSVASTRNISIWWFMNFEICDNVHFCSQMTLIVARMNIIVSKSVLQYSIREMKESPGISS